MQGRPEGRTEPNSVATEAVSRGDRDADDAGGRWSDGSVFQVLPSSEEDDDAPAGAGFLAGDVRDGAGLTCAHVVRNAGQGPGGRVRVCFPNLPGAPRSWADVPAAGWRDPEAEDVAVLRVESVPAGAHALRVGTSAVCRGHAIRSFGFPAHAPPGGHFGEGTAGELLFGGINSGRLLQLSQANDLTTGFSGGPVVDEVTRQVVGMVTSFAPPDAHLRGQNVAYATPAEVLRDVRPELAQPPVCPYLGLEPFTARDAEWFHGREAAVQRVLSALGERRRMTLLLGPSGAGKSSLVSAGVLPALARGALPGSERWLPLYARPGQDLLAGLEAAGLPGASTAGPAAAAEARLAGEPQYDRLLLVIDQFEELLTQAAAPGGATRLSAAARQLVGLNESAAPVTVLLIMRDDFYARLGALAPDLQDAAVPGLCNIPAALRRSELKAIITGPAAAVGVPLKDELADRIVGDVLDASRASPREAREVPKAREAPKAREVPKAREAPEVREAEEPPEAPAPRQAPATLLPLLELALRELFENSREVDGSLTHAAYDEIGGVTGSMAVWCERAFNDLREEQRPTARRLLTALVRPADEAAATPATRQLVPLARLRALAAPPQPPADDAESAFDAVLATLTRYRIVTTGTAADGEPAAELIHDALIRDWADLRDWVAKDQKFHTWLHRAAEQHRQHAASGLPGDLLDGSLLTEGEEWSSLRSLPPEIASLLAASRRHQHAAVRRTRRLNAVLAGLLALALVAGGVAFYQRQVATDSQRAAQSRQLAAMSVDFQTSNPDRASLLAVKAWKTSHTDEAAGALYEAPAIPLLHRLTGADRDLQQVAFSPDGRTLAGASGDGTVRLWDTRSGEARRPLEGDLPDVQSVAFAEGGRTVVGASKNGAVQVWIAKSGRSGGTLEGAEGTARSAMLSRNGETLATVGENRRVRVWEVDAQSGGSLHETGAAAKRRLGGSGEMALSPNGKKLAVATGDGKARVWDVGSGEPGPAFDVGKGAVRSLALSDDGTVASSAAGEDSVRLWDVETGDQRGTLQGDNGPVETVVFAPDGKSLAGSDPHGTVRVWDMKSRQIRVTLKSHKHTVNSMAFSPEGTSLATVADGVSARLWDARADTTRTIVQHDGGALPDVAFRPDGRTFATAGTDKTAHSWKAESGKGRRVFEGHEGPVTSVAFSPDGTTLATAGEDKTVRLWDAETREAHVIGRDLRGAVSDLAFSPDGTTLAGAGLDGTVRLWNAESGAPRGDPLEGKGSPVRSVAFSPDRRTLATAAESGTVRLWDVRTHKQIGEPSTHERAVNALAFSPTGGSLALAGSDGVVLVRDMKTGAVRGMTGHTGAVKSVAYRPVGGALATAGSDGAVRLRDSKTGAVRSVIRGHTDAVNAVAFSPDGKTLVTASEDGTARLWDVDLLRPEEISSAVCKSLDRDFTEPERAQYLNGVDSEPVCP